MGIKMEEYRIDGPYHYDGKSNYSIERKSKNGKWIFVIGGLSYSEAKNYVDNPEVLKNKIRVIKISVLGVFLFGIISLLIYFFTHE